MSPLSYPAVNARLLYVEVELAISICRTIAMLM